MQRFFICSFVLCFSTMTWATQCGPEQSSLVELYTSQGCSSCPPAERWLNSYVARDQLWSSVVPVAFHVDYWDYLGWKDELASSAYSRRQRKHQAYGNIGSVYTPGLLVNGREWKGYRFGETNVPLTNELPGLLDVALKDGKLSIQFDPTSKEIHPEQLHVAWLRMGFVAHVRAGENAGRALPQEFSVLAHQQQDWNADEPRVILTVPEATHPEAVAVWLSDNRWRAVQACGTFITS